MEVYNGIRGTSLNSLLYNKKFRSKTPDSTKKIPSLVSPINVADNYGLRLTTYYVVCYFLYFLLMRFSCFALMHCLYIQIGVDLFQLQQTLLLFIMYASNLTCDTCVVVH